MGRKKGSKKVIKNTPKEEKITGNLIMKALLDIAEEDKKLEEKSQEWAGFSAFEQEPTRTERKKFLTIRGIVLDCHNTIELCINSLIIIAVSVDVYRQGFSEHILARLTFDHKVQVIKKLRLVKDTKKNCNLIDNINQIRIAFAHGYRLSHKKFLYKNNKDKHIINRRGVIVEFQNDAVKEIKELLRAKMEIETHSKEEGAAGLAARLAKRPIR